MPSVVTYFGMNFQMPRRFNSGIWGGFRNLIGGKTGCGFIFYAAPIGFDYVDLFVLVHVSIVHNWF